MIIEKPKFAFTANAFVHCLQTYGDKLFDLVPKYGKLYVNEKALCEHEQVVRTSLDEPWLRVLIDHWFDITDPDPSTHSLETELTILSELDKLYPDNLYVVVDKLREYSRLNRIYSDDELLTTIDLHPFIYNRV